MSAYICTPETIDTIVSAASDYVVEQFAADDWDGTEFDSTDDMRDAIARMLVDTNVVGVLHRYGGDVSDLPGHIYEFAGATQEPVYAHRPVNHAVHVRRAYNYGPSDEDIARRILGAIGCYRYQASEHRGWVGSCADRFTTAVAMEMASIVSTGWEVTSRDLHNG